MATGQELKLLPTSARCHGDQELRAPLASSFLNRHTPRTHYTFQLHSLDPNPRAKKTMMASSAALLQASTAFASVFSPLPSRLQPAPRLHLRGSPNRRRRGVALAASSAASPEVEKEPSTSSSSQESEPVSTHGGCSRDAGTYSWLCLC